MILVDTVCAIDYSTADAAIYTALPSQADSKNNFLEFASTVKQAEGVVCIECLVAKENDAHVSACTIMEKLYHDK